MNCSLLLANSLHTLCFECCPSCCEVHLQTQNYMWNYYWQIRETALISQSVEKLMACIEH